jgi:hypothetical protein
MYPKEMYKDSLYCVAHSMEAERDLTARGWSDQREEGKEYTVHTAVAVKRGPGRPPKEAA